MIDICFGCWKTSTDDWKKFSSSSMKLEIMSECRCGFWLLFVLFYWFFIFHMLWNSGAPIKNRCKLNSTDKHWVCNVTISLTLGVIKIYLKLTENEREVEKRNWRKRSNRQSNVHISFPNITWIWILKMLCHLKRAYMIMYLHWAFETKFQAINCTLW